jgi:hypothetical protein
MRRLLWAGGVAGLLFLGAGTGVVNAQIGGTPAAPAGVAPAGPAPGAAATIASATPAKAGFFQRCCLALDECKRKLCLTPAGQMLNNAVRPAGFMTGGVIPPFCPLMPSEKDLAKPGVAGAAAMAQKEALEAKQRRDAVRFLGTLDCRYFPDAAVALAAALRTDSSECVRWEAAIVLGRGCCCTELTMKALDASVSGTEIDGNPAERSVRVRIAAAAALDRCLSCYVPPPEPPPIPPVVDPNVEPPVPPKEPLTPPTKLPAETEGKAKGDKPALAAGSRMPSRATAERARKTLNAFNEQLAASGPQLSAKYGVPVTGRQSLYHLFTESADPADPTVTSNHPREMGVAHAVSTPIVQVQQPAPSATSKMPIPMPMPARPAAETPAPQVAKPVPVIKPAAPPAVPTAANPSPHSPPAGPVAPPVVKAAPEPATPTPPAALPPIMLVGKPVPVQSETAPAPAKKTEARPVAADMPVSPVIPPPPAPSKKPTPVVVQTVTPPPAGIGPAPTVIPATPVRQASKMETGLPVTATGWAAKVRDAATPADRMAAVRKLASFDGKQNPVVVDMLLAVAKRDTDQGVRLECLRHLAAYPQVKSQVWALTADPDPVVRKQAAEVMSMMWTDR